MSVINKIERDIKYKLERLGLNPYFDIVNEPVKYETKIFEKVNFRSQNQSILTLYE